jgi:hypothetical protein
MNINENEFPMNINENEFPMNINENEFPMNINENVFSGEEALALIENFRNNLLKQEAEERIRKCEEVCENVLKIYSKRLLELTTMYHDKAERLFRNGNSIFLDGIKEIDDLHLWGDTFREVFLKRGFVIALANHTLKKTYSITPVSK